MNSELDHMPHTRIFCSVYIYTDYPTYQSMSVAHTLHNTLEWKQTYFTSSSSYFCLELTTTTTTTTTTTIVTVMTLVMYLLTLTSLSRLLAFVVSSLAAEK